MPRAFICDFVRTPFGRYGGALRGVRADDLAAWPLRALVQRHPDVDWEALDDILLGCANQAGEDNRNVARMAGLLAGLPVAAAGITFNRLCASGLDAVGWAARAIRAGDAALLIAGGVESMTRAPFVLPKSAEAFGRRSEIHDTTIGWRFVNPRFAPAFGIDQMPETAENVAAEFSIGRDDQDLLAWRSQTRCAAAETEGFFRREIAPVVLPGRKAETIVDRDEHPRPDTTFEALAALPTPFRESGTVTAGNSSGINDGAAALLIASAAAAEAYGLTPRAEIVAMRTAGVPPRIMGIGPVAATRKLLAGTGLSLAEIDHIELNEAFAAQALAVTRSLGLTDDDARVNPNGGAIAIGHPLGASGARLVMTAVNGLETTGGRRAIVTMCVGVGQGVSLLLEKV